jgi:hypothetical protein
MLGPAQYSIRSLLERAQLKLELAFVPEVIRIKKCNVSAVRRADACISCSGGTTIPLSNKFHATMVTRQNSVEIVL